jgi:uncharacterized integral membrane protein
MLNLKLALSIVLASVAVLFIAQNVAVVEIGFLAWKTSMSSALLMFFVLVIGFLLGWSVHGYLAHRRAKAQKNQLLYMR